MALIRQVKSFAHYLIWLIYWRYSKNSRWSLTSTAHKANDPTSSQSIYSTPDIDDKLREKWGTDFGTQQTSHHSAHQPGTRSSMGTRGMAGRRRNFTGPTPSTGSLVRRADILTGYSSPYSSLPRTRTRRIEVAKSVLWVARLLVAVEWAWVQCKLYLFWIYNS